MKLGLTAISSPQAENLRFRAVRHVDHTLKPPPLDDGAAYGPQNEPIVSNFEETELAGCVGADLDGEAVSVHLARSKRLQVDIVSSLH